MSEDATKIVASFTRYSANTYEEVWWALNVCFVLNFLRYVSVKKWQNWTTSDWVYHNNKKGDVFFLRHSVVVLEAL